MQKPLVTSRVLDMVHFDELPGGQNAIIAVMSFTGSVGRLLALPCCWGGGGGGWEREGAGLVSVCDCAAARTHQL